jgi:hypothetical protein
MNPAMFGESLGPLRSGIEAGTVSNTQPARCRRHGPSHLSHVHALFFDRLEYMLTDPAPVIRPYLPGDQDADDLLLRMDLDACLDRFVVDRSVWSLGWRRSARRNGRRRPSTASIGRIPSSSCSGTWRFTISCTPIASRNCCFVPIGRRRPMRRRPNERTAIY